MGHRKKPVEMFDLKGNKITEFESVAACALHLNTETVTIRNVIKGERKHHKNFVFRYKVC